MRPFSHGHKATLDPWRGGHARKIGVGDARLVITGARPGPKTSVRRAVRCVPGRPAHPS
jgi:hypothetical protein